MTTTAGPTTAGPTTAGPTTEAPTPALSVDVLSSVLEWGGRPVTVELPAGSPRPVFVALQRFAEAAKAGEVAQRELERAERARLDLDPDQRQRFGRGQLDVEAAAEEIVRATSLIKACRNALAGAGLRARELFEAFLATVDESSPEWSADLERRAVGNRHRVEAAAGELAALLSEAADIDGLRELLAAGARPGVAGRWGPVPSRWVSVDASEVPRQLAEVVEHLRDASSTRKGTEPEPEIEVDAAQA